MTFIMTQLGLLVECRWPCIGRANSREWGPQPHHGQGAHFPWLLHGRGHCSSAGLPPPIPFPHLANSCLAEPLTLKPSLGHFFSAQNFCLHPLSHDARTKLLDLAWRSTGSSDHFVCPVLLKQANAGQPHCPLTLPFPPAPSGGVTWL